MRSSSLSGLFVPGINSFWRAYALDRRISERQRWTRGGDRKIELWQYRMIKSSNIHIIAIFTSYDMAWGLILILYLNRNMPINFTAAEILVYYITLVL